MDDVRGRPIDVNHIPYYEQKEFFKLDRDYEETFVQKHAHNVGLKQRDTLKAGLMAKLNKDRKGIFKQYVTDHASSGVKYKEL